MPVTLNIGPPAFGSDGIDPDNPDLFGGYAGHCSRLRSTDIRTGRAPGPLHGFRCLFPAWREGLSFFTGGPLKEKTARTPMLGPREHHPPELPLFFCGYPCTIYEKCCKGRYSLNRMTEETPYEGRLPFGTENKIVQNLRCYT